jgi:mercuric ion transport protein
MKLEFVEKVGSIRSIIAAAACPTCFPLLAVVGAALGLGVLRPLEGTVFLTFQVLVGVALVGYIISFLNHRELLPLIVGIISP